MNSLTQSTTINTNRIRIFLRVWVVLIPLFTISLVCSAQQCVGWSNSVSITNNIGCSSGPGLSAEWDGAIGGTITDGLSSTFQVTWTASGTFRLKRRFPNCFGSPTIYSSYITIGATPAPPSPAELTQQVSCRSMVLNYTGGVYNTYWQTSVGGRDETFRTTMTVNTPTTYYARIKGSNGCWSNASSIVVSSMPVVSAPSPSEVMQVLQCNGIVLLYKGTLDGYWQTTSDGESLSNQTQLNVTSAGNYYLRIKVYQDCWSDPLLNAITGQVPISPCPIVEFPDISYTCSSQQGYVVLSSDKVTDRWFQTAASADPLSASNSIEVPVTVNTYYIETTSSRGQVFRIPYEVDKTFTSRCGEYLNSITSNKPTAALSTLTLLEPVSELLRSITYFDGVGRSVQEVVVKGSSKENDVVRPIVYDLNGREFRKYLPFVSSENNGDFKTITFTSSGNYIHDFYNNPSDEIVDDPRPFSETIFEPSPLNRPSQTFSPGQAWKDAGKTIGYDYLVNAFNEVYHFEYDLSTGLITWAGANSAAGFYDAGQLYANKTTDEQKHDVIEYVDKEGRTVCKKVEASGSGSSKVYATTYYIYDDLGNLVVVLPPEGVKELTK